MKFTPRAWRWRRKHLRDNLEVLWDDSSLGRCWDYICQWLTRAEIKEISSWPAARAEFLIEAIISMTSSSPRRIRAPAEGKLFLYPREESHRQRLIFIGGDKPTLIKGALNLRVMAPDLYAWRQSEWRAENDLFFSPNKNSSDAVRGRCVKFP